MAITRIVGKNGSAGTWQVGGRFNMHSVSVITEIVPVDNGYVVKNSQGGNCFIPMRDVESIKED
jgi:hypothetical protein